MLVMSIRWLQNVSSDTDYYIKKNYDQSSLLKVAADIKAARKELDELDLMIYEQMQLATKVIKYNEIRVNRNKSYKGNVEIYVGLYQILTIDGQRLDKSDLIYGSSKKFAGNEKKQAKEYAKELEAKYHCPVIWNNWK